MATYNGRQSNEWNSRGATRVAVRPQSQFSTLPSSQTAENAIGAAPQHSRSTSFFSSFSKNSSDNTHSAASQAQSQRTWDEHGRPTSSLDLDRSAQNKYSTVPSGKLISPRNSANAQAAQAQQPPQRRTSIMGRSLQTGANQKIHPDIENVVQLTLAHSSKIYCSGPMVRRIERQSDGTTSKDTQWVEVWAQLGGTTLSVWDMEAIRKASREGREEPPTYINVTDSHVQVLGSVTNAATPTTPEQRHNNVITLNTAGSNLILLACPSSQTLISWATALRLAAWEKSRIEEIYTGHLFKLSMFDNGQFREPETTLVKGKLEGWAKVRVSGSTEWQRLWVVVSLLTPSNISVDMGRPSSPSSSMKKNRMSGFFGGKSSNASSSALQVPTIAMYPSNKAKDKKRMMYTATRVTQAFAVYPERPEVITQSTLFKVEATVKDEAAYSSTVHRGDPHEGYILMIPEVEPGRPGSTEMLRWLVAIHDAFKLYGRPEEYTWEPRDPRSMFFTYPYGPFRDHLFLDRELAEVLDPRIHETSKVRNALLNVLIQRLRGPGPEIPPAQHGSPQLPPLNFNGATQHPGRSDLSTIEEQRTVTSEAPKSQQELSRDHELPRIPQSPPPDPPRPSVTTPPANPNANNRSWAPSPANDPVTTGNSSPRSFNQPRLSLDTVPRTSSPLRKPEASNTSGNFSHSQVASGPTSYHSATANSPEPSVSRPTVNRQSSWLPPSQPPPAAVSSPSIAPPAHPPPATVYISPPAGPPPSSSPVPPPSKPTESSEHHLYNEPGALYMLQQMDDEPPEVSPYRDLPPQPLPPRLAALKAQESMDDDDVKTIEKGVSSNGTVSGGGDMNLTANEVNQTEPNLVRKPSGARDRLQRQLTVNSEPFSNGSLHVPDLSAYLLSESPKPMSQESHDEDTANALVALALADGHTESTILAAAPPAKERPSVPATPSTGSETTHQYPSSFSNPKVVERKQRSEAHYAASQENMSKPGHSNGTKGSKKKSKGAWGSSDEEEEEEDDTGDEGPSERPLSIVSPQPQQHASHPSAVSDFNTYSPVSAGRPESRPPRSRQLPAIPSRGPSAQPGDRNLTPEYSRSAHGHERTSSWDPPTNHRPAESSQDHGRPRTGGDEAGPSRRPAENKVPSRPVWSTVLDPRDQQNQQNTRDTFVTIEPNQTMTKAFAPHGLLHAGIQDREERSAKKQEEVARETGVSLVNVPNKPPPPQMGLLGAITAHERERNRDGGVGATLTERERDRRIVEERQRKFDELQRERLDQALTVGGSPMDGGYPGYNPMMLNPMMSWGMPMMYPPMGMPGWSPGISPQQQQQQQQQQYQMWAAQQAAMQAYQSAMMSFSQAGSDAGISQSEAGAGGGAQPNAPASNWGGPPMGMSPMGMPPPMMSPMMPGMMPGYGMSPFGMGGGSGFMSPSLPGMGMMPPQQQASYAPASPDEPARLSAVNSAQASPRLFPNNPGSPRPNNS